MSDANDVIISIAVLFFFTIYLLILSIVWAYVNIKKAKIRAGNWETREKGTQKLVERGEGVPRY